MATVGKNITQIPTSQIQSALGITADNVYGQQTTQAVRNFQQSHGLTVDGIVGQQTIAALGLSASSPNMSVGTTNNQQNNSNINTNGTPALQGNMSPSNAPAIDTSKAVNNQPQNNISFGTPTVDGQPIPNNTLPGTPTGTPAGSPQVDTTNPTPVTQAPPATPTTPQTPNLPEATTPPASYTIQKGDTLASIAQRYGTTVSALASANAISNPNKINAGKTLKIPNGGSDIGGAMAGFSSGANSQSGALGSTTGGNTGTTNDTGTQTDTQGTSFQDTVKSILDQFGIHPDQSPQSSFTDVYKQVYTDLGLPDIKSQIEDYTKQYTALQNEKTDEATKINNDPWIPNDVRIAQLRALDEKYASREDNLLNNIKLRETLYESGRQDAQYITSGKIEQAQKTQALTQDIVMKAIDIAEKQAEAYQSLINKTTPDITEYNLAKSEGYKGSFTQYQKEQANLKAVVAKAGASTTTIMPTSQNIDTKETSEALGIVNSIKNILDNPNFDTAFGATGIIKTQIPGTAEYTLSAQIQQIKDKLSLAARGQLKGQGQISNFEGLMLQNAQTALRTGMKPADARQEFINIAGAINTSTGGKAKVQLKDKNGTVYTVMSDSRGISQAIADGLSVKYVQ